MTIARRRRREPFIVATAFGHTSPLVFVTDHGWVAWASFWRSVDARMPVTCRHGRTERGWHPGKGFTVEVAVAT